MNVTNINQKSNNAIDKNKKDGQNSGELSFLKKGQVIEGLISKVSDKISINFNDREVNVSKSAVRDAREGEIRKFRIMDVSDTSIVLKEVGTDKDAESRKIICTNVEMTQSIFKENLGKSSENKNETLQESEKKLGDISERMTAKDYELLMKEGKVLEAYDLIRLEMALEQVKEQRHERKEGIEKEAERIERFSEQTEKTIEGSRKKTSIDEKIANKLLESDLPVTEDNMEKIKAALELSKTSENMSDKAMSYLLKNNLEPTIENVYKAQYSGNIEYNNKISDGQWEELQDSVEDVIKKAGFDINEENLSASRWILDKGLPLTEENLKKLADLKEIKNNSNENRILDNIIETIKTGIKPEAAALDGGIRSKAEAAVNDFKDISDEQIVKAAKGSKEINLEILKHQDKTEEGRKVIIFEELIQNNELDIKAVTAKRQIEEIRLKMTVEVGAKLMKQGININTEGLQRIVEGLREIENSYYKNLFSETGDISEEEKIQLLNSTMSKVSELKTVPDYVLGSTFVKRDIQTIESLHSEGLSIKSSFDNAKKSYETLMTSPRKDMGDSIEKAFRNIDDILVDLDMESTKANQRAVKILGYNNIEITRDSIMEMKAYDAKVNDLIKNLHPAVAVDMIREGVDTLNTPIDELNDKIMSIRENLNVEDDEKYSKYLWKMEKNEEITAEERKAYIGIYRLLDKVEKSKGAAVGAVVNAGQEVNLKNLLTSIRTVKSNGINAKIDDETGILEKLNINSESITDQISYMNSLVRNIKDNISPDNLNGMNKENIYDMPLENLYESMDTDTDYEYELYKTEKFRDIAQDSHDAIELLTHFELPDTVENIIAAGEYQKGSSVFKKAGRLAAEDNGASVENSDFSEFVESFSDNMTNYQESVKQYEKLEEKVSSILKKAGEKDTITSEELAELKSLKGSMRFTVSLSKKESYEIPVMVEGRLTSINLTIINSSKEIGKVNASVNSEELGDFKAEFTVKNEKVKGFIIGNSRKGLDTMKMMSPNLENSLSEMGLELNQLAYGMDSTVSERYISKSTLEAKSDEEEKKVSNSQLYQIAKAFVANVKAAEISNIN